MVQRWLLRQWRWLIAIVSMRLFVLASGNPSIECFVGYHEIEFSQSSIGCPATCPYKNACASLGTLQCVTAEDCPILQNGGFSVPGSEAGEADGSGICVGCSIVACRRCSSNDTCLECEDDYELTFGGHFCAYSNLILWLVVPPIFGVITIWALVDFARAHRREVSNHAALLAGLRHRFRMKARQNVEGHPLYPLGTSMHAPHGKVLGPDLALFMNWFLLVAILAIYLMVLSVIFKPDGETVGVEDVCVQLDGLVEGSDEQTMHPEYRPLRIPNVHIWTGLSYGGSAIICVLFICWQHRNLHLLKASRGGPAMLHRFAVEMSGFPVDATDHAEIHAFLDLALECLRRRCGRASAALSSSDFSVEISICFDFLEHQDSIEALADEHLLKCENDYEASLRVASAAFQAKARRSRQQQDIGFTSRESRMIEEVTGDVATTKLWPAEPHPGPFMVQLLSFFMLGTDLEVGSWHLPGYSTPSIVPEPAEAERILKRLTNSGSVIVVLQTESLREAVVDLRALPLLFRGRDRIWVRKVVEEPSSMQWASYTRSYAKLGARSAVSVCIMVGALVLWVILYFPWAQFAQKAFNDASNAALAVNTLMGGVIALGNAMLAAVVGFITNFVGFRRQSITRLAQLLIIVPCTSLNVICDILVTARVTYFKYRDDLPDDLGFQISYGLQLLQNEVFALLVPGYCILPYVVEPLATVFLPLWLGIWRVKSDTRITPAQAERLLIANEFDMVNPGLADIIVITSTFTFTFVAPAEYHWSLWLALLAFAGLTYSINRVRILWWQSSTSFPTDTLYTCECFLWALPVAMLAGSFGGHVVEGSLFQQAMTGVMFFFGHIALHVTFVWWLVRFQFPVQRPPGDQEYHTAMREGKLLATYRNTNPVEVLRSQLAKQTGGDCRQTLAPASSPGPTAMTPPVEQPRYAPWLQRPLVLFHTGRQHLQPGSAEQYDGMEEESRKRLRKRGKLAVGLPNFGAKLGALTLGKVHSSGRPNRPTSRE